jgi:hypothetical protein
MSKLSDAVNIRLDEFEALVDQRADPEMLAPKLNNILTTLSLDSEHRPRALRLSAAIKNRRKLYKDALADLGSARAAATAQQNHLEVAKIERDVSLIYAWRGDDRAAALELLHALTIFSLEGDRREIARTIAELGRIELEARRFDRVVLLLRLLTATADQDLPAREADRLVINLCQALNGLGKHEEVLVWTSKLQNAPRAVDARLQFLMRLEEARAFSGLGGVDAAGESLKLARELISDAASSAFEHTEYKEVEAELKLKNQDLSAVEDLRVVAEEFVDQDLIVRAANIHLALADTLMKIGKDQLAREVWTSSLQTALDKNLVELADRIRTDMIKSVGAGQLAELAEAVELIGGQSSVQQRFVLLGRLGKGGAGEVYKAFDLSDGQYVALKKLDLSYYAAGRREFIIDTIKTEYAVALSFVHPGFARVRDLLIEPKGSIYIIQEFIDGPSLRQVYEWGDANARIWRLLADVADALVALHAKGIVHRDLKPENVVLRDGTTPVLIDLGIAAIAGKPDSFKHVGTPGYIAPEQAFGANVDYRADVYALGKMIAETWVSKHPSSMSILLRREDGAPRTLRRLVRQMLRTSPERRLGDLKLVASTLRLAC